MLSECRHQSFIYGLDYCPQCGETDISKLLHERYIHELKARIAELETLLRAEQGYTELNEARIKELEKVAEEAVKFSVTTGRMSAGLERALRAAGYLK